MQPLHMNYTIPMTSHLFSNIFNTIRYNLTPQVPNFESYTFLLTPHALLYNLTTLVPNLKSYTFLLATVIVSLITCFCGFQRSDNTL